ncbi:MAG TPA: carbohydrate kinase family protein [Acidimicrobiales bacterium]|nr:carbohydrate kinase family protein [Acidimicrobiales bacterium]
MRLAVTGSIANDYLMTFAGRFGEQLVPEQLHRLSLSFLVDELVVRRGGVAGNIAFGMAQLGEHPILVGAVGPDFDEYRSWLERHGVDCESVHVSEVHYTARFFCTTDEEQCQIASFYTGAMADARNIELEPVASRVGGLDLVIVSPNDPEAMRRHTDECRQRGIPFVADPSQQLARIDADEIEALVTGARYLVTNDYEWALIQSKTGWTHEELITKADICVTTHGAAGCVIEVDGDAPMKVPAAPVGTIADPTGVGDAFRAGFLAGQAWGVSLERSAQVGSVLASIVLEGVGTQEYSVDPAAFCARVDEAYGTAAADEVRSFL